VSSESVGKMAFIKLLNRYETHHGFQYKTGYNEDFRRWTPNDGPGGIYFCEERDAWMWVALYASHLEYVRPVSLPRDAKFVKLSRGKWKASAVVLGPRISISDWLATQSENQVYKCLVHNPYLLTKVHQTEDLCLHVLTHNKYSYRFIENKTPRLILRAIIGNT
jgi:hypothetical protein